MNPALAASDRQGSGRISRRRIQVGIGVMTRAIAVLSAAHLPQPFANFAHMLAGLWREITRDAVRPYRPELHYMRGPGPAWHAKNGSRIGA